MIFLSVFGLVVGGAAAAWAAFSASTSTPSNSFSAAASFCQGDAYNPVWMTGFEAGATSSAGGGIYDASLNVTADSSIKRSGDYSMRLDATGAGAYTASAVNASVVTFRFAVRFASLPAADVATIAGATVTAGSALNMGFRKSDNKLTLRWGTATPVASLDAISAGTWYVIDLRVNTSASRRTADWQIDGVGQTPTFIDETATTIGYIGTGTAGADVFSANYDDLLATTSASDYPIGPGRILSLRPNGALTHNASGNFRDDDTTAIDAASWSRLDESPMDTASDYVAQVSNSTASYLAFSFEDPSATCIKAVTGLVAFAAATGSGNSGKTSVFVGSTERVVYSGNMSGSTLTYQSASIMPSGSTTWTTSAVSGLSARVGYSGDASPNPRWQSLMLSYETQ